jgi:hypothetical protein
MQRLELRDGLRNGVQIGRGRIAGTVVEVVSAAA